MDGPLKFLTARKILPLLDLLAKFKQVLACSCSPNFALLEARKANFLFLLVLAKKSQCSACSRMLAKTIRHPYCDNGPTLPFYGRYKARFLCKRRLLGQ